MKWFQHANNWRETAKAKWIQRVGGDRAFAAAIRLMELQAQQWDFPKDGFEVPLPMVDLVPPQTLDWLGHEILSGPVDKGEIEKLFDLFMEAGFIERKKVVRNGVETEYIGIYILGFEKQLDEWSGRKRKQWEAKVKRDRRGKSFEEKVEKGSG